MAWLHSLRFDPIPPLVAGRNPAVRYWAIRDLTHGSVGTPKEILWDLPVPRGIVRRQGTDGSWTYPGRRPRAGTDYNLLETYRQLGFLVEMFGLTREHPALAAAAEFVFSHQSAQGDLRGIYGNQYSPNYTAGFLELLVKAGYPEDPRVELAFNWLEAMRQDDGGWALPLRTRGRNLDARSRSHTSLQEWCSGHTQPIPGTEPAPQPGWPLYFWQAGSSNRTPTRIRGGSPTGPNSAFPSG
jgi:hypothetical protein